MSQVRTLITTVAGAQFKQQHSAVEEFWRRMKAANGGRQGDPHDYAEIVDIYYDEGRGWVIEYEVPAELLEQRAVSVIREDPEPNCQNVLEPAKLAEPTPPQAEPVFESVDGEQRPIPVKDVMITGWNPRKAFDAEALQALAEDIRQNGLINPIMVRPKGKRYELVAGERRLRAFRLLGWITIPAKVRELTDEQVLDIMLAENLQRVDLNPIEEAHHLKRVLEVGKLTQTELGKRIGKSQEWVSARLRLAEAPSELQDLVTSRLVSASAAADILTEKNRENLDDILLLLKADVRDTDEGEGISRERVRMIIHAATWPESPRSEPMGVGPSDAALEHRAEAVADTIGETYINESGERVPIPDGPDLEEDSPFVNPEDCKDCDIYDRATNTCPEGCTNAEECEDSFCEVTDDEEDGCEMFGAPGAADDEVCAVDCPDYDACKSEAAANEDDDYEDLPDEPEPAPEANERPTRCTVNSDRTSLSYNAQIVANSNGDVLMVNEFNNRTEELGGIVTHAIGMEEGDTVPVTVVVRRGEITIRRRGKF